MADTIITPAVQDNSSSTTAAPAPGHRDEPPATVGHRIKRIFSFIGWMLSGFGLLHAIGPKRGTQADEVVVYSVHRAFYLWTLILVGFLCAPIAKHNSEHLSLLHFLGWLYLWVMFYTFLTLLVDVSTLRLLLWTGILAFVILILKYLHLKHIDILSKVLAYFHNQSPELDPGFVTVLSWLLLFPWLGSLFHSYSYGRKSFTPNGIEERFLGEGWELTDRSGLHFVARYRDLLETISGFGAGDLEAVDSSGKVIKKWENVLGLLFVWKRLDQVLHQRAATVDTATPDKDVHVEIEPTRPRTPEA
ncbi:MAG TPA: hypothetical protein VIL86_06515 [Tepidisphaeraceae bacterium]|jgi:hypothetical protein